MRKVKPPDYTIPLIYEGAAYSPTNGIASAGFLYIDIRGNQYPTMELDTEIKQVPQMMEPPFEKHPWSQRIY